jgi:UTP--glucose-1-phosphate uridylyltransferase
MNVSEKDVSKYGIAEVEEKSTGFYKVTSLVEKPKPSETKSRWALPGRYVFDNAIMDLLQNAKPSLNGEIQLTDSMKVLCEQKGLNAMTFSADRYDAGDKLGYLQANIELALKNPELGAELKAYILDLAKKFK